jgi:hypothetical protein
MKLRVERNGCMGRLHEDISMVCFRYLIPAHLLTFSAAYNEKSTPTTIDVQKLKVSEAIRRTEEAIRDVLLKGDTVLRVVTDGTVLNATHLAIIGAMQKCVPLSPSWYCGF